MYCILVQSTARLMVGIKCRLYTTVIFMWNSKVRRPPGYRGSLIQLNSPLGNRHHPGLFEADSIILHSRRRGRESGEGAVEGEKGIPHETYWCCRGSYLN